MLADGGAQRSVKEELRAILSGMSARTWKVDAARALGVVDGMP